jgi:hypothetical protein
LPTVPQPSVSGRRVYRGVSYLQGPHSSTPAFSNPYDTFGEYADGKEARAFFNKVNEACLREGFQIAKIAWIKDMKTGRFV